MKNLEVFDQVGAGGVGPRGYGEPYQTPDGATVITVTRILDGSALGVFVIHGGQARWVPAVDGNRVALIGVTTGLLAAVIGCLAVLRRPPWPQITRAL